MFAEGGKLQFIKTQEDNLSLKTIVKAVIECDRIYDLVDGISLQPKYNHANATNQSAKYTKANFTAKK